MSKYIFFVFHKSFTDTGKEAIAAYREQGLWVGVLMLSIGGNRIRIKDGDIIIIDKNTNTFFNDLKYLLPK